MTWNTAWMQILKEMKQQKIDLNKVDLVKVMKAVNKLHSQENKSPQHS